jgi:hypothetical protein
MEITVQTNNLYSLIFIKRLFKKKLMAKDLLKDKKFLWVTGGSGRRPLMTELAKKLESTHNIDSYYLSFSTFTEGLFDSFGISQDKMVYINYDAVLKEKDRKPDLDFLQKKEIEYGFKIFDIWNIYSCRYKERTKIPYDNILIRMEHLIKEIEVMVENIKPDYAFVVGISAFEGVVIYKMLTSLGIEVIELKHPRIPKRLTFNNNMDSSSWPLLIKEYDKLKQRDLNPEERKIAEEFIDTFGGKRFKSGSDIKRKVTLKSKFQKYKEFATVVLHRKRLPPSLKPWLWYPIKDRLLKYSSRFEQPQNGEKYVYFPLHIQPEASTSIFGKWFMDQPSLIESIAKSVPSNYKIYVKEHVLNYSTRPSGFHKRIKQLPNVRLISPFVNSTKLSKHASLILTITGTAGWESILMQKPVITFGDVFYNVFDEIKKVRDITKLTAAIQEKLDTNIDKEKTLKFITAMYASTFPGIATLPSDCQNVSISDENLNNIVEAMQNYLQRIKS